MAAEREKTFVEINNEIEDALENDPTRFEEIERQFRARVPTNKEIEELEPHEQDAYLQCAGAFLSPEELINLLNLEAFEREHNVSFFPTIVLSRMVEMERAPEVRSFLNTFSRERLDPEVVSSIMSLAIWRGSLEMARLLRPHTGPEEMEKLLVCATNAKLENASPYRNAEMIAWLAAQGVRAAERVFDGVSIPKGRNSDPQKYALTMLFFCFPELCALEAMPVSQAAGNPFAESEEEEREEEVLRREALEPVWEAAQQEAKTMIGNAPARETFLLGTTNAGANSPLSRSFAENPLLERQLAKSIFEHAGWSPHLVVLREIKNRMDRGAAQGQEQKDTVSPEKKGRGK